MLKVIKIEEGLKLKNVLFIDVRSPLEFKDATIPGAINVPILDDEERACVGTIYRKESSDQAINAGLNYATGKLPHVYNTIKKYANEYDHVIIFCWRGGMRSRSVCTFLSMLNIKNVHQLAGGYRAYRKYLVNYIENNINRYTFIMIHGLTGVGKTHILDGLKALGKSVLNLEELAQNSGSVFGGIVFDGRAPSQKMFDARLFQVLYKTKEPYIFVESESKRIGNIQIPGIVYDKMTSGYHVLIKTNLNNRIHIILKDYVKHLKEKNEKIIGAIGHLRKRLGNAVVDTLLKKIEEEDYIYVIKYLIKNYYDPLYQYSIEKYEHYNLIIDYNEMGEAIEQLVELVENIFKGDKIQ